MVKITGVCMKQGWITDELGTKCHYVDDKLHRDDGPAIIF